MTADRDARDLECPEPRAGCAAPCHQCRGIRTTPALDDYLGMDIDSLTVLHPASSCGCDSGLVAHLAILQTRP